MKNVPTFSQFTARLRALIHTRSVSDSVWFPESPGRLEPPFRFGRFNEANGEVISAPGVECGSDTPPSFRELALELFALQFEHVASYRQFCESRRITPATVSDWPEIPAIPASAFKDFDFSSLPLEERTKVFYSSGTTARRPSRHFHNAESLDLYEIALLGGVRQHLLAGLIAPVRQRFMSSAKRVALLILTPSPAMAPHSSLVHMFDTVRGELGANAASFLGQLENDGSWTLPLERTVPVLRAAAEADRHVVLLGTALLLVQLLDRLQAAKQSIQLPPGSRVLETGGYKGRSRTLPKTELHQWIATYLDVPTSHIVSEYGMSELSSQAYDGIVPSSWIDESTLAPFADGNADQVKANAIMGQRSRSISPFARDAVSPCARVFQFPPWARALVVSPETGRPVADGETGLIRVFDLANVRSVMALQTEDLGTRRGDGFEWVGRAAFAEARGCSLMSRS